MTQRAFFLGFCGALALCSLTYFNDFILRQTLLIGNHFPVSIYGLLFLFLPLNLLLFSLGKKWAFTGAELAVVLTLTLTACCIPSSGLLRTFSATVLLPHYHNKVIPGWSDSRVVTEATPRGMLVEIGTPVLSGTILSATTDSVQLPAEALADDHAYDQMELEVVDPAGSRQVRTLRTYNGSTRTGTLDAPWKTTPAAGCPFTLRRNNEDQVLTPFLEGRDKVGVFDSGIVPWSAWWRTLAFWIPLLLLIWFGLLGLSLVFHRQWANHEHLPYPIAALTASLLPDENNPLSGILKDRRCWLSALIVIAIYLNNYVHSYAPEYWFRLPLNFDFSPLVEQVGALKNAFWLKKPTIFLSVVAIAWFLTTDVSLSVGLAPIVYLFITGFLGSRGASLQSTGLWMINEERFLVFGAWLGAGILIFYTGRRYYLAVLRRTVGLSAVEEVAPSAIWGLRVFLGTLLATVVLLANIGLDWQLGLLYALGLALMFTIMSRILAETGLFFIQPWWMPCGILIGLLGLQNLDPKSLAILFLLSMVLAVDPREALMPFISNGLRLLDLTGLQSARLAPKFALVLVLGMAVALPLTLRIQYSRGANMDDTWTTNCVSVFAFRETINLQQRMEGQGLLDRAHPPTGFRRLLPAPMKGSLLVAMFAGAALFILTSLGRLRFPGWPIHPVLFLIWASYSAWMFAVSFLLGWLLKTTVMHLGGSRTVQQLKPVMIGLAAGEIIGALIPVLAGFGYFLFTGNLPSSFHVFP